MKGRSQKEEGGMKKLQSVCGFLCWAGLIVPVLGQSSDDAPPLLAPLPEIPPTFWEQYAVWVVTGGSVLVGLMVLPIWWWMQPKPVVPVPIEIQTRRELEALGCAPENGQTLSKLSRCLRRYFAVAFELPPGEMTTTEFNRAFAVKGAADGELVEAVGEFLRRADEKKFAPGAAGDSSATRQALELFERGERRRVELIPKERV